MRNTTSKKKRPMLHRLLIPLAVVTSSVAILSVSYWYHEQQLTARLMNQQASKALNQQIESQISTDSATHLASNSRAGSSANKTQYHASAPSPVGNNTSTSTHAHSTTAPSATSSSKTMTNRRSHSNSSQQSTAVSTVTNQTKKPAKTVKNPSRSTPSLPAVEGGVTESVVGKHLTNTMIQSTVVQFGSNPQTTGIAGHLQSDWGTSLSLPKSIATNRLLAVSLHSGVLWAIVSPTDIHPNGQLGAALGPTNVMYTPYPAKGTESLDSSAIVIGQIPVSTSSVQKLNSSWTHVPAIPTATAQSSSTPQQDRVTSSTMPQSSNNTNGTSNTTANHTANGTTRGFVTANSSSLIAGNSTAPGTNTSQSIAQNSSPQSRSNNMASSDSHVFLSSLYQDDFGAVIVLDVLNASGMQTKLVYSFDELTHSIKEIASLPNDGQKFSWLAVGKDHLYFGIRTVDAKNPSVYHTKQYLYNLGNQSTHAISLGTWAGAVYISNDNLVFQVRNTTTWKEFIPSVPSAKTSSKSSKNTSTKTSAKTSANTSTGS